MSDIIDAPIEIHDPAVDVVDVVNEDVVRIALIVDESGSMSGCAADTVKNLNGYIDEQASREKKILVSLYTFESDQGIRERYLGSDAKKAEHLTMILSESDGSRLLYKPAGMTPLYDAVGTVISRNDVDDVPTLVVILTDGAENHSREWTHDSLQELIKKQETKGWSFVFLMAGMDRKTSVNYASSIMGRSYEGATMSYSKGLEDVAFQGLAAASATWENSAREVYTSGGIVNAEAITKNFFNAGDRDIKEKIIVTPTGVHKVKTSRRKK
jgi:hypothetical protein